MKSVYLKAPNDISIQDIGTPLRKDDEVLVKVISMGICGSDIGAFRGVNPLVSYPRVIGHEVAGIVIEAPENDRDIKAGDRVILEPYIFCGKCYPCSMNRTNCCEDLHVLGVHTDGAMSEYFAHKISLVHKVPDNIPWEEVPMAEPLTIALHAIHRAKLTKGEHIAITGSGTIGLLTAQAALSAGAVPIVIDIVEERLNLAKKLGVKHTVNLTEENAVESIREITAGRMAEVVVEASGADAAIKNSVDYVSYAGRISLVGWPKGEVSINTSLFTKKELDVRGSRNSACEFPEAIKLISSGEVNVKPLITCTVDIAEVPDMVRNISEHPEKFLKVTALT